MGLFDFLKKKKNDDKLSVSSLYVAPESGTSLLVKGLTIHDDIRDLIWIGDGKYKNYKQASNVKSTIDINGIRVSISFMNQEEPSLIYTNQKVEIPKEINQVERPPYYPNYSSLTPEQKWIYLKLLSNPYDTSIDIGFVFILYYGLERHLLNGKFEEAINVIIKLRNVHINKSFQSYSANAVVLSCMLHKRGELVLKFMESIDKEHELEFSNNLFLICYFSFDLPIRPQDIIRMAKTFEFNNTNYIKKYPELFIESLKEAIKSKDGVEIIDLKKYLTSSEIKKVKKQDIRIFANMSIGDKSIPVPILSDNFKLKTEMYNFLETAHENIKKQLAKMKKTGQVIPENKGIVKPKIAIVFDVNQEITLLAELTLNKRNPVKRHFSYISLQKFYYKYRTVDDIYLKKCIEYCNLDISSLSEMQEAFISEETNRMQQFASLTGSMNLKQEIVKVRERGFTGNIPAFKRLVLIYEKQEKYEETIDICDRAIAYGQSVQYFVEKKQTIQNKMVVCGDMVGSAANQQGSEIVDSYQGEGGKYYQQVNYIGDRAVKIIQNRGEASVITGNKSQSTEISSVIAAFSGTGGKNTRPFVVNGPWEIRWDAKGDLFQLYLNSSTGEIIGVLVNQQGDGIGYSYHSQGGEYYLQINAIGDWSINIVQTDGQVSDFTGNQTQSKEISSVIAAFSGTGGKNTRPFLVTGPWEIQWNAKGDLFQLYLNSSSGDIVGVPANQQGAGIGYSYQAKGGEYYLQVNALGDWAINIVQTNGQVFDNTGNENMSTEISPVIADFSGSGGKKTNSFLTTSPWEIQWDANGFLFQLYLYSSNGDMVGIAANQQGAGKGTSYQPKAGKYYLQVNAIGNWSFRIVPVK